MAERQGATGQIGRKVSKRQFIRKNLTSLITCQQNTYIDKYCLNNLVNYLFLNVILTYNSQTGENGNRNMDDDG
jgi:K+-transporting ATPase c subunit